MKWNDILTLLISTAALAVSLLVGWYTSFKPAKIIGDISYMVIWRYSSNNDGVVTDVAVTPAFWLRNVGARPIVIKDLRLVLVLQDQSKYEVYPVSSVPLAAIESSTEFNDYGRMATGSPFRGFCLTSSELWTSSYRFSVSRDLLQKLKGKVKVVVQVSTDDKAHWENVAEDSLDFGVAPYHLQKILGSAQSIPVYTQRWAIRRYK